MKEINNKLFSWASVMDAPTEEQAKTTASLPFIHPHVALMPDAHLGKGSTVGSVIPTLGTVIPSAVGVDIGCGMIAVRTQFHRLDIAGRDLKVLREQIERAVPSSMGNENRKIQPSAQLRILALESLAKESGFNPDQYHTKWREQLGTLGGGNHFIEVCLDEEDRVWLFLHSGSRGVGNKIAQYHINVAIEYCKRHWIPLADKELSYLVEGTPEFDRYLLELQWAQQFALYNREEMMDRVVRQLSYWMGEGEADPHRVFEELRINTHHNYTVKEKHFGKDVWLTRKGAVDAALGKFGLIPGSMGTRSYVVVGKGNRVALNSAPHGAGRRHSRNEARKLFTQEDLRERMKGIEFRNSETLIDEIPDAYKDIDVVMQDAADLVAIKHTLRQILNVKGD
jgi:tRNA-splicing ligase RtcB (3'-phosphate/5'-hydroxy nucleic acid ligase)